MDSQGAPQAQPAVPTRPQNRPSRTQRSFRTLSGSEVSLVIKYLLFGFNVVFWMFGVALLGIGIWAVSQKSAMNVSQISSSAFNPVLLMIIGGCVIFVIGFFGCIGALRENTILLIIYMVCVLIVLLLLIAGAIIVFAARSWLETQLTNSLKDTIVKYRDDADLQNLIDWVQSQWLHCCGFKSYTDWGANIYFNCSSPGVEACGVPFSCCKPSTNAGLTSTNLQCGYGVQSSSSPPSDVIYLAGCIDAGNTWFNNYMVPVAGAIVAVAVVLILGICCSYNLYSDIKRQKAKWKRRQRRH